MGRTHLALLLGLGAAAGAASPPQQVESPVLSIRTDLVTLPVTVVDRHGTLVSGLRAEHFTVFDNDEAQTIQFFTSDDLPATIGLIIDSSGSMRGRRDELTTAAEAFITLRHPLDEFFTLNFNDAVWPGLPPGVAFTEDADQLRAALSVAPAEGMTALYDAVDRGLTHLRRGSRDRKALILVSDGGDNASVLPLDAVVDHARRTGALVYSVTLFDPDNREARRDVLKTLARDTGGRVFRTKRSEDVARAFAEIAREIRSGYTIGFAPVDKTEGGFRSIRVAVDAGDHRQLIARTRAGYYAGRSGTTGR
jgi:Ca-activated chloride channel family protein